MSGCVYTRIYSQWIFWSGNIMWLMAIKVTFHIDLEVVYMTNKVQQIHKNALHVLGNVAHHQELGTACAAVRCYNL
jgi:hypothetical protein